MLTVSYRESLREQNAANEEIAQILGTPVGDMEDELDLEEELERMRQEQVDEEMLKTGTVPVSDKIKDLPAAATGERTSSLKLLRSIYPFREMAAANSDIQSRRRLRRRNPRKKPSCAGCRQKWPCEGFRFGIFQTSLYMTAGVLGAHDFTFAARISLRPCHLDVNTR